MSRRQLKNCAYSGTSKFAPDWGNALSGISVILVVDWYLSCLLEIWELDQGRADVAQLQ